MPPPIFLKKLKKNVDDCLELNSNRLCVSCPNFQLLKGYFQQIETPMDILSRVGNSERHAKCLCLMFTHFNSVLTKEQITKHVWGHINVSSASVPVLIFELRDMIQDSGFEVINSRGRGYALIYKRDVI
ncbi:winged helix-turn-helix domain-containing protein [Aeromonas enteropelogenes]|uniref:winged helix-turn-helix domain-containing protein n=1 Tax=Aeromonas enteropelogenes TaxID=29489 RepID=UPI003B9E86EB